MSSNVTDPIADMLTRIRNAIMVSQSTVSVPHSKLKESIAQILRDEGYLDGFEVAPEEGNPQKTIRLKIRYVGVRRERRSVLTDLQRVSRPGRRVYVGKGEIPWVLSGMGVAVISTPKGVMTGQRARALGVGGEVLCQIW
ncbi:MAG: 30S ribosomal protein S8 [Chloroflexota bacterium]|jgi:small subunit ribosomal protein S8|nr:30S ribosomal protein S8 [Anaerolineales bacterium]